MVNPFWRAAALSGGLATILAANAASDPPHAEEPVAWRGAGQPAPKPANGASQLKADLAALKAERMGPVGPMGADTTNERAKLHGQVLELLKQLKSQPAASEPPPRPNPVTVPPKIESVPLAKPGDGLQAAINLFRANDAPGALRALTDLDQNQLTPEDRLSMQYLKGCCLRRTNRLAEATAIFREVANSRDDAFVAEAAVTQLALIRSVQELEAQLDQLRARPKR